MFKKNLEAIRFKNPQLAEKLEKIDINSITGIEVFKAESNDLIISYKNMTLHSAIDPVREAKTTWNRTIKTELNKNDIQVVFGLGLGYLFKRAYVNAESKIFIIEPFIEIIRFVLEHVDFSLELSDARVYITDNVGDIYNKLQKEYLSGDRVEFLFLNQYAIANQELLQNLTSKTFEIVEGRGNDENTIFNLSKFWTENFIKNIVHFSEARPLGFLEGKFSDKTALILSAGPSLADDIEKIKNNQDKFVTIAVGRVFKTLVEADIIPDFTIFADARYCSGQILGVEEFLAKTNVVLLSKADNYLYNLKSKSKILYFSETDSMVKIFENENFNNPGFFKSGSSVSVISYYFAKALGFGQIIFSGLDLAFSGNKIYANGDSFNPKGIEYFDFLFQYQKLIYVKDRDGNDIMTRADYAWFIRQFNEIFTEEINLARIINTSLKGAFIEGMEYIEFSELVKTLSAVKPNVDEIISSAFAETKGTWASIIANVCSGLSHSDEELEKINTDSLQLHEELDKICTEFRENGKIDYNPDVFRLLSNKIIETRQMLIDNVFISNSMQKTIWNYTKNYVTKPLPSKEDVIGNLELDRDFFCNAKEESIYLSRILKETLTTLEEKQEVFSK